MWSSALPRKTPDEYAQLIVNGSFIAKSGILSCSPGFDIHALAQGLPGGMNRVISLGFMPFVRALSKMGLLIAQIWIDDPDYGIRWYSREINFQFDPAIWGNWVAHYVLGYGETVANRIRWQILSDRAMRGACGNEADNIPIWCGYINRNSGDDHGYIHIYYTAGGYGLNGDIDSYTELLEGETIPVYESVGFSALDGTNTFYVSGQGLGAYSEETIILIAVPIIDGYQSLSPYRIDSSPGYLRSLRLRWDSTNGAILKTKFAIQWTPYAAPYQKYRLTGFYIYQSECQTLPNTPELFGAWKLVRHIDIRDGVSEPIYSGRGHLEGIAGNTRNVFILRGNWPDIDDLLVGFVLEIMIPTTTGDLVSERYIITSCASLPDGTYWLIFLVAQGSLLLNEGDYDVSIYEKWVYSDPVNPGENIYKIPLILKNEPNEYNAPAWMPNPNQIGNAGYSAPEVRYNYVRQIEFQDRHIVGDIYDFFLSTKFPLRVAYTEPKLTPHAGLDIFQNIFDLSGRDDDVVRGFTHSLNMLSIFTKYRIFKAAFEPILTLRESPYPVGLAAPDSLCSIGLNHWFLGQSGTAKTVYKYDGIHQPVDIGYRLAAELDAALSAIGCVPELSQGWYDKDENQYRLAVKTFEASNELWLVVIDKPADLPPSRRFFKSSNGGNFQQINMGGTQGGWNIGAEIVNKWKTVSFEFLPDGTAFWAATTTEYDSSPQYCLYCRKYTVQPPDWQESPQIYDSDEASGSDFFNPDVVLDSRSPEPMPILLVNKGFGGINSGLRLYWMKPNLSQTYCPISGSITPTGKGSIVRQSNQCFIHCDRVSDNSSYLYSFGLDASGIPAPPLSGLWEPIAQPNMPVHQMAVSNDAIGILGRDSSSPTDSSLDFRLFQNGSLGDREVVMPAGYTYFDDAFALIYRDGQWQALIAPYSPTASDIMHYKRQSDGTWYLHQTYPVGSGASQFNLFGISRVSDFGTWLPQDEFGCMFVEVYTQPYQVRWLNMPAGTAMNITTKNLNSGGRNWQKQAAYRPVAALTPTVGEHVFPYGNPSGVKVFCFDVDTNEACPYESNSSKHLMADIIEIQGRQVFSEGESFYYYWDDFKDYFDDSLYLNRDLRLVTTVKDGGIRQQKIARRMVVDFDIPLGAWLDVIVYNENNEAATFTGDPDNGGTGLARSDSGKMKTLSLLGQEYHIDLKASCQVQREIHSVELDVAYFGGIV